MKNMAIKVSAAALAIAPLKPAFAAASDGGVLPVNSGDTAFVLFSAALVLLMTIGLAFFYGGLVRRKNMLSVLVQCIFLMGLIGVQWVVIGYTLSFGPSKGGLIGGLDWIGLKGVGVAPFAPYSTTIPHQAFMIFQCMFAVITPGLIIGAFAERFKFSAFVFFSLAWSLFVYDPVCHWVWGVGGFIRNMGALDFAGGTVVHVNAGVAAIVCAIVLGKRAGYPRRAIPPHSLPFALLGAGLLWFGWFGFNAGSALAANGLAVTAFVTTNTAAAAAVLAWSACEWINGVGKPTMLGMATGAVAGLVAITPAAGFVSPMAAVVIGAAASFICYFMVAYVKERLGYDDSLDAFGVHGIGGLWGALATGLFASKAVNPAGVDGLFYGNPTQFIIQVKACAITIAYSLIVTFVLLKITSVLFGGLRVSETDERIGLDLTQHHESAYTLID